MSRFDKEPWARPEIENEDQEPKPELKVGDRTRLGREVVAKVGSRVITGPEPKMNFLRIKPEQENEERDDE